MSVECCRRTTCGYRVWIAECPSRWKPVKWSDIPPEAKAIQPIGDDLFTEERASDLVEGFNRVMLRASDRVWAVAVPSSVRFDQDLQPGRDVVAAAVSMARCRNRKSA